MENWKQVVGHPDYLVSDLGNFKSLKQGEKPRKTTPSSKYGHRRINFRTNGKYHVKAAIGAF